MKHLLIVGLLAGLTLGTAACQTEPRQEVAEVPPPPAFGQDQQEFEPVEVEDYDYADREPEPMPSGQTATPQAPPQPQAQAQPQQQTGQRTYTVQEDETLWGIANREYGDGQRWQDIVDANPDINNPDEIYEGQQLILPD